MRTFRMIPLLSLVLLAIPASGPALAGSADLEWARENYYGGRYADAAGRLKKVLEGQDQAEAAAARIFLARIHLLTGKYDEAAALFAEVKEPTPEELCLKGEAWLARGKYQEAGELFQKAFEASKEQSVQARINLIDFYELTNQRGLAELSRNWFFKTYQKAGQISYTRDGKSVTDPQELLCLGRAMAPRDPQGAINAFTCAEKADKREVEPYVQSYHLFAARFAWGEADKELAKALTINKSHPEVKLAAAWKAFTRDDDAKAAEKALDEALAVNPNLSGARVLRANLSLFDDEHEKAKKELDAALAVNPNDLGALAVLAAWHYDQGQQKEFEAACKRVLEINPGFAGLHLTLAGCCERKRQFPAAESFYRKAVELDPRDWQGHYGAGMALVRRGLDAEGKALLEKAWELNKYNIFCRNMLVVLDKLVPPDGGEPKFEALKTEHFMVLAPKEDAALTLPYYGRFLEEAYARMKERYRFTPEGPLVAEVFNKHGDFSARTAGLPGLGADGACFGKFMTLVDAKVWQAKAVPQFNWAIVAEHELMHVFSLQATGYRVPRWLTEGLSVYEESAPRVDLDRLFLTAVNGGQLVKVADMNRQMSRPTVPINALLSYYQASRIVDYIYTKGGAEGMPKLLAELRAGKKPEEAIKAALNLSMEEFEAAVLDHQKKFAAANIRMAPQYDQTQMTKLMVDAKENPDDPGKLAALADAYASPEIKRYDAAKKYANEALKKGGAGAAAGRANAVLGVITFEKDKNYRDSKELFEKAVASDPENFNARLYLGRIAVKEGDWKGAVEQLEKARAIYPRWLGQGEMSPFEHLYKAYDGLGDKEKALAVLRDQVTLDKFAFEPAVLLAKRAIGAKKYDLAQWACYQAIKVDNFAAAPHLVWGEAAEKAGDLAVAEREYANAARLDAAKVGPKVGLARVLWAAGKKNEARQAAAEAAALDKDDPEAARLTKEYGPPEAKLEPKAEEKPAPKTEEKPAPKAEEKPAEPEPKELPKLEKL
jgi:lipopolysaccharide biosynthesis regulator YciM